MSEIVYGDNGQWGVVASGSTTWFDDVKPAFLYAAAVDMTPEKAAEMLDGLGSGLTP